MIQTTFTYLDWRIAERIYNEPLFNFQDVYQNQCLEVCHCIFPYGRSILHMMLDKDQNLQELF
jgi:hypothetical protein